ncbi:MAG: hypothetical protein M1401_13615 [Chloroflexi bacterium]|nr:hypothetical protein [Bacteroidota bacterium]MCL5109874.1 hypothetical protein [Chloroflexota bacterium]
MARRVELAGGGLAAVIGLAVGILILALGGAGWAFALAALSGLGAGVGAYRHASGGGANWLALLWASAAGLTVLTILAIFSVGILLVPGAVAALVAAVVGSSRSVSGPAANP